MSSKRQASTADIVNFMLLIAVVFSSLVGTVCYELGRRHGYDACMAMMGQ
jgi:hypothetical protein